MPLCCGRARLCSRQSPPRGRPKQPSLPRVSFACLRRRCTRACPAATACSATPAATRCSCERRRRSVCAPPAGRPLTPPFECTTRSGAEVMRRWCAGFLGRWLCVLECLPCNSDTHCRGALMLSPTGSVSVANRVSFRFVDHCLRKMYITLKSAHGRHVLLATLHTMGPLAAATRQTWSRTLHQRGDGGAACNSQRYQ